MNFGILILVFLGGAIGLLTWIYLIVSLFGMIGYKIYRSIKYHVSLYD